MDRFEKRDFETKQRIWADRETALTDALVRTSINLKAAISLLENTPNAEKAAASDKMFAEMVSTYKESLNQASAALEGKPYKRQRRFQQPDQEIRATVETPAGVCARCGGGGWLEAVRCPDCSGDGTR